MRGKAHREFEFRFAVAQRTSQARFEVLIGGRVEALGTVDGIPLACRGQPLPHLDAGRGAGEAQPVGGELLGVTRTGGAALRAFHARRIPHHESGEPATHGRSQQREG